LYNKSMLIERQTKNKYPQNRQHYTSFVDFA
jgi:hypothetical protein